jgi:hypothetical protein
MCFLIGYAGYMFREVMHNDKMRRVQDVIDNNTKLKETLDTKDAVDSTASEIFRIKHGPKKGLLSYKKARE